MAKHIGLFIAGVVVGGVSAAAAVALTAPKTGSETRESLFEKSKEIRGTTSESLKSLRTRVAELTEQTESVVRKVNESGIIERAQELYDQLKTEKERRAQGETAVQEVVDNLTESTY